MIKFSLRNYTQNYLESLFPGDFPYRETCKKGA